MCIRGRRLVELRGGTIGVGSTVGVGRVFWFELTAVAPPRLASGEFESVPREPRNVSSGFRRYTPLSVEDNPANLRPVPSTTLRAHQTRPDTPCLLLLQTKTTGNDTGFRTVRSKWNRYHNKLMMA